MPPASVNSLLRFRSELSVLDPERRAFLGSRAAPVVEARSGDAGVAEPFLDAADVGVVLEGVGRGRGPERMHAEAAHEFVEPGGRAVVEIRVPRGSPATVRSVDVAPGKGSAWVLGNRESAAINFKALLTGRSLDAETSGPEDLVGGV